MARTSSIHGEWSTRLAFILAATGSAVGLGNIWKFPYITGQYGGGAFVLVYLLCIALIGLPVMMAEIMIGRRGRQSPINTMTALAAENGRSTAWGLLGWMGVVAGFLILSYYSVIAGWALAYIFRAAGGLFVGMTGETADAAFVGLVSDPERLLAWHTIFMVMTAIVVARGVRSGLEQAVRYMMPGLFAILMLLVGYALAQGDFAAGARFLFAPDFSKLSGTAVLVAMGHSFFTLSLGMGAIMVYGSYLNERTSIAKTSMIIVVMDTVVALLAGLAIFPIVFANGLEPAAGPGLVFKTLPIAFGAMPGGAFFGTLFFVLLVLAAWTSAISLVEPAVAWLVENRGMTRNHATVWVALGSWVLGIGTVLSFNHGSDLTLFGKTFFDLMDFLTSNVMLPLGGLCIALFAGWAMARTAVFDELQVAKVELRDAWYFVIRYIAPAAIFIVLLNAVGVF